MSDINMDTEKTTKEKKKLNKAKTARYFETEKTCDENSGQADIKKYEIEDSEKKKFKKPKTSRYFESDENKNEKTVNEDIEIIEAKMIERKSKFRSFKKRKNLKPSRVDKKAFERHSRGEKADADGVKTDFFKKKLIEKEKRLKYANEQAARTEILLSEEQGFIIPDEEERTADYTQKDIIQNVDITTAAKHFKLSLDFGPYNLRYTKNGRHLLLGGRRGHVAAFDWITKKLYCEMNVMEEIADISWLHIETMFACAQKNWVHFYDKQGTEIHCVKRLYHVNKLEFLPYHFLLAAGSAEGYLTWLDISIGEIVGNYNSKLGNIRIMRQNPANGVMCLGSGNGVVSMWSPTVRDPIAKMLCHSTSMTALAIDPKGKHMVTSGLDKKIKVWDVRELSGPMAVYNLKLPANEIDISQRGVLAFSTGNICDIYSKTILDNDNATNSNGPYLRQRVDDFIYGLRFCPYEDILGVTSGKGFTSLIVPGSGEPNFDALEANPFQTKSQRREHEVHALLEKIPPEFISLSPDDIAGVDVDTLRDKVDAKKKLLFVKPPKIDFQSRRKMKGKGGSANAARNKQIVREEKRKEFINEIKGAKKQIIKRHKEPTTEEDFIPLEKESTSVLDRFKTKKKN